jgi:hypothetical protein
MDDPLTGPAKAVEETAKVAGKALDTLNRVFGDVPGDLGGVVGGAWLHEFHTRLRDKLRRRTDQILRDRNVQEVIKLSPNVAAALISGAQEEASEELAELWARLLANAMDPKLNNVRQSFVEAVKKMDPPDAVVLLHICEENLAVVRIGPQHIQNKTIGHTIMAPKIGRTPDEVEVSLRHLEQLGFFDVMPANPGWYANATFREFMRACYPEIIPN